MLFRLEPKDGVREGLGRVPELDLVLVEHLVNEAAAVRLLELMRNEQVGEGLFCLLRLGVEGGYLLGHLAVHLICVE
jgi:hypothetical protein